MISMADVDKVNALTIWNDRSQGGSVHYDGAIKLLVDRRVMTKDFGGIPEKMYLSYGFPLVLHFRVKLHKFSDLKPSDA